MSQRRIAMIDLDGGRLTVVWMDERGENFGMQVLRTFDVEAAEDPKLLELLEASLAKAENSIGSHIQIQARSTHIYKILAQNLRLRARLSRHVGPEFIHEEFKAWAPRFVDALEELPRTKGASDNGISAEEGDSNE